MVKRPLKDKRPIGPLFSTSQSQREVESRNGDPTFESIDDLPDSPMLREYIRKEAEYFNADSEEIKKIINSKPVEEYMKRLGVWEQAVKENS